MGRTVHPQLGGRPVLGGCCAAMLMLPVAALAQKADAGEPRAAKDEIIITSKRPRGSAVGEAEPIAILDSERLGTISAATVGELMQRLKAITTSTSGGEPVLLLNGRRVASPNEVYSLPTEAIERTEVLPEQEAPRFGLPPTVRVVNFITKKRFRALMAQQLAGATTDGGGATNYVEATATRIDGPRRATLNVSHFRHTPVFQRQRSIVPDPDILFSTGGTVAGLDGTSLDPRLDAIAGRPVRAAAVPGDPATRQVLAAYAEAPHAEDIGAYRTLVPRKDTVRLDGTFATPITRRIDGSLNLTMEAERISGLSGLAQAQLRVPGDTPALPFADDVLLYRYLPEAVLRQAGTSLNLHAAGTLQGGVDRWQWSLTTSYDRIRATARSEQGVPLDALQAAIDAGGDPLQPLSPALAAGRLTVRSRTVTGTLLAKATANGPALRLPAGEAQITVAADYARARSDAQLLGQTDATPDLARTTRGASVHADVPIASAERDVLGFLGRLAANGTIGTSEVSGFGRLVSASYGLTWTPAPALQFTAAFNDARTAPEIGMLTNPVITTANVPFFDFTTGSTALVTLVGGGNAALAPERRRTTTLGVMLRPIKDKELRFNVDYLDTRISDQAAYLQGLTPAFQQAFPGLFVRDPAGALVRVDLRPVNLAEEHERKLRFGVNLFTQLGRAPAPVVPAKGADPAAGPPPAPPKPRPTLFAAITTNWRLSDRLSLLPGSASLDLLDGASLTGGEGRARWDVDANFYGSYDALGLGFYARINGPSRVRSDLAASDLRFSGRNWIVAYGSLDAGKLIDDRWAQRLTLTLTVENLLNDRVEVRDRNGFTPNRFQRGYLDPLGRSIRLGVRKLF